MEENAFFINGEWVDVTASDSTGYKFKNWHFIAAVVGGTVLVACLVWFCIGWLSRTQRASIQSKIYETDTNSSGSGGSPSESKKKSSSSSWSWTSKKSTNSQTDNASLNLSVYMDSSVASAVQPHLARASGSDKSHPMTDCSRSFQYTTTSDPLQTTESKPNYTAGPFHNERLQL